MYIYIFIVHEHAQSNNTPSRVHLLISFQNGPFSGSLDLGGASTEIAFQYSPHVGPHDDYVASVELFKKRHQVYARSYLCYGLNEARWRLLAHLIYVGKRRDGDRKGGREKERERGGGEGEGEEEGERERGRQEEGEGYFVLMEKRKRKKEEGEKEGSVQEQL